MREIEYNEVEEKNRKLEQPSYIIEEKNDKFLIIIGRGKKPTAGYDINIEKIVQKENKVIITVRSFDPDPDEFVAQIITYPQIAITINKKDLIIKDELIFLVNDTKGEEFSKKTL